MDMVSPIIVEKFSLYGEDTYFKSIYALFNKARSIEDWYSILDGLVEYLECRPGINPMPCIGMILYSTLRAEMTCYMLKHKNLIYIQEFLTYFYNQNIFSSVLDDYFQLVETAMIDNKIYGQKVHTPDNFIQRYNKSCYLITKEIIQFDTHEEFFSAKIENNKYTLCPVYADNTFMICCCYNPEQLARYKNIYVASTRRFKNTKVAKN